MNHFFAIPLPPRVREYVADQVVPQWRNAMGRDFAPQWYGAEDYHITLKFLGNVPTAQQARLIAAAEPVATATAPFGLGLAPPGTFPRSNPSARVFWMGVAGADTLAKLAAGLDTVMSTQGFPRDARAYSPHITLARRRRSGSGRPDSVPELDEQAFPFWQVNGFALMQTSPPDERQNSPKTRYNIVHLFPFGTPPSSAE